MSSPDYGEALSNAARRIHEKAAEYRAEASEADDEDEEAGMRAYANGLSSAEEIIREEYDQAKNGGSNGR